jgi:hypothetical protein
MKSERISLLCDLLGPGACAWAAALSLFIFRTVCSADTGLSSPASLPSEQASNHLDAGKSPKQDGIVIERVETEDDSRPPTRKEVAWLGVGTEEVSEALSAQLNLPAGQGLLVTYVAADSPAARAGLQKNDVLAELSGQLMVHPIQLRKLVQMRKPGDAVQLDVFHAGTRKSIAATLGKTSTSMGLLRDERSWHGDLQVLNDMNAHELQEGMDTLNESLTRARLDGGSLKLQIQRSIEEAGRAAETALRHAGKELEGADCAKLLEDLARSRVDVNKNSTVIVNRKGRSVQTQVKADDTGTYVIVASPKKRLTAHDRNGKLLFDGEIETPQQQDRVPRAVWTIVEPMIKQMDSPDPAEEK